MREKMILTTFSKPTKFVLAVLVCAFLFILWIVFANSPDNSTNNTEPPASKVTNEKNDSALASSVPVIQHLIKDSGSKPTIKISDDSNVDAEGQSTNEINQVSVSPETRDEIIPGLEMTEEQWVEQRALGLEAEVYLLSDDRDSESSPEFHAYIQDWREKVESDFEYLNKVEEDARSVEGKLSDELPTFEGHETLRIQGEEAERLLPPLDD